MAELVLRDKLRFITIGDADEATRDAFTNDELEDVFQVAIEQMVADVPRRCFRALASEYNDEGEGVTAASVGSGTQVVADAWAVKDKKVYYAVKGSAEAASRNMKEYCPEWYIERAAGSVKYRIKPKGGTLLIADIDPDFVADNLIGPYRSFSDAVVAFASAELTHRMIAREVSAADFTLTGLPAFPAWDGGEVPAAVSYAVRDTIGDPSIPDLPSFDELLAGYLPDNWDMEAAQEFTESGTNNPGLPIELGQHLAEEDIEMSSIHIERLRMLVEKGNLHVGKGVQELQVKLGAYQTAIEMLQRDLQLNTDIPSREFQDNLSRYKMQIDSYVMQIEAQSREKQQQAVTRDFRVKQWFFQYERAQKMYRGRLRNFIRRSGEDVRPIRPKSWLNL